jgi:DNA-binding MarR family transcriptional regulator
LSTALLRLSRRGLVVRERDTRDRRRVVVGLTAKGRAFDRPLPGTVEVAVTRMLGTVTGRDVDATQRCVRALVDALLDGRSGEQAAADQRRARRARR